MNTPPPNKPLEASDILIDLLTCFVATNGVGLKKGYEISKELHDEQVVVIDTKSEFICCNEKSIYSWLNSSSYPRGEYVARLVATRIRRSAEQINSRGGVQFLETLHDLAECDVRATLSPLYGVGEKFIDNYLIISPRT